MPTYSISGPDGAEYEIDAPHEDAAMQAFQSLGSAPNAPAASATDLPAAGLPGDGSAAVGRGLINGIPVVGPALLGGVERAAAGVRSLQSGQPYDDELKRVQGFSQATADANPKATTGGEIGGGVLGTAPAIAAAPAAFGAGAGGLGLRTLAALGSGAAIGGGDAAVRSGGDAAQTARGIVAGGAFGSVAPAAGSLLGAGMRKFGEMVGMKFAPASGFGSAATKVLGEDIVNSGGVQPVRDRMAELGAPAMLLDASNPLQGQAQGLAVRPETRGQVVAPIAQRAAGMTDRLAADVDGALGPAVSPQAAIDAIKAQRAVPNAAIGDALRSSGPIDTQPLLQGIDKRLGMAVGGEAAALQKARGLLAHEEPGTGWITMENNPQRLHGVKQELDSMIQYGDPGLGIPAGALQRQQGAVKSVRGDLNDLLREKIPGYAEANDRSAALARQTEAVEAGSTLLRSGEGATAPPDLARRLAAMSPEERAAMATGTRGAIDQAIGTKKNDLVALQGLLQGEGGWNTANLAQLHGAEPVQRLVDAAKREAAFNSANENIVKNSQTTQRTQAADRIAPRATLGDDVGSVLAGLVGGPQGIALAQAAKGAKAGINAIGRDADIARNKDLARAVTLNSGDQLDQLLAAIQARGAIQARAAAVGNLIGRGGQAAALSQGDRAGPYLPEPSRLLR